MTQTEADRPLEVWIRRVDTAARETPKTSGVKTRFRFISVRTKEAALLAVKRGRFALYADAGPFGPRFHFDPANSEAQLVYLLLRQYEQGGETLRTPGRVAPLSALGSRYIDFLVPGLIALGIMNSCLWGAGWALIERRMKKLLRRMVATPMKKHEFLLSYFFTRLALTTFEIVVLYFFSRWYFNVQVQGSWLALSAVFLAGNMAFIGIAVLAASRTQNTQVGNGVLNAITVPMTLLSGIFFSYYNFPEWMIGIVRVLPLTLLADGLRQVFIEGAGIIQVSVPALALAATGAATFWAGLRIFKWH